MKSDLLKIIILLCLLAARIISSAQEVNIDQRLNTCIITEPTAAADTFPSIISMFGPQVEETITGEIAVAFDGMANGLDACSPLENSMTNRIALIERGVCPFSEKVLNAQEKGAIAVIIGMDDRNGDEDTEVFGMSAQTSDGINIPAFFVSRTSFLKLLDIAQGGLNLFVSINYFPVEICDEQPVYDENTVWGQNGEGDFIGGLNGWTTECTSDSAPCWNWTNVESVPSYYLSNTLRFGTVCNGFVYMSSDRLDNGGLGLDNAGGGTCPSVCLGSLISPNIDLTGLEVEGLKIQFDQAVSHFDSQYEIAISYDGGESYTETIPFNETLEPDTRFDETTTIAIPSFNNQDNIKIKFNYYGNYNSFAIDDVRLIADSVISSNNSVNKSRSSINIFPNPATNEVNLEINLEELSERVWIDINTIDGRSLKSLTMDNVKHNAVKIELDDLRSGVYLLSVKSKEESITRKLTIL